MTTNFLIPIERLTSGNEIMVPDFGSAEVYGVEFDGEGYLVTYCTDDRAGWDALDTHYVRVGESVEYAIANSQPRWMRSRAAVTAEEWEALAEVENNRRLVEDGCAAAVADALGVSSDERRAEFFGACDRALMAAE
jgi:hypothetical protein